MDDTIKYYEENALEYISNTKDADMSEHYLMFLSNLEGSDILDVGFGSLRDSYYFRDLGFNVSCLDPVKEFCNNAITNNFTTYNESIIDVKFSNEFNGIWACASLLHIDSSLLNKAFYKCYKALKSNGIMYCSFKVGDYDEFKDGRYFNYITKDKLEELCIQNKFKIINIINSSDNLNRDITWISAVIKKR